MPAGARVKWKDILAGLVQLAALQEQRAETSVLKNHVLENCNAQAVWLCLMPKLCHIHTQVGIWCFGL